MMKEKLTQKDYELINSYLDQELDRKDVVKFADRMAGDPEIAAEVSDLMKVKSMIKELPTVTPPRNYILTRAMAEEARPKPFWERLFPVFRTAAAFCALALIFTFVFPNFIASNKNNAALSSENTVMKSIDTADLYDYAAEEEYAAEAAPGAVYDEEIVLEDMDYGAVTESYTAVMPSYGVRGGNPRIEYLMRQEEKQSANQSAALDPDNPPEGFISVEKAEALSRDRLIKAGLGMGLLLSIGGIIILQRRKRMLEVR